MFVATEVVDSLSIQPSAFEDVFDVALENAIRRKYSDKVLPNKGLCICLHEIKEVADKFVLAGYGAVHVRSKFTVVLFRPFVGELMQASVLRCTETGVQLTTGFFQEIHVPAHALQIKSHFRDDSWVWETADVEGESVALPISAGDEVLIKVKSVRFPTDHHSTQPPPINEGAPTAEVNQSPPMVIEAAMNEPGLGHSSWWEDSAEAEEEYEEGEGEYEEGGGEEEG